MFRSIGLLLGIVWSQVAHADTVYRPNIDQLSFLTDAVIEVDVVSQTRVRVTKVWLGDSGLLQTELDLPQLATLDMDLGMQFRDEGVSQSLGGPAQRVTPTQAVLFVNRVDDAWTLTATGSQGSPSTFWIGGDGVVYCYDQLMNPGDLQIVAAPGIGTGYPKTLAGMQHELRRALGPRQAWDAALAMPQPERARRIAAFTSAHTAPDGYRMGTVYGNTLMDTLVAMGEPAVQPLIKILRTAPPDANIELAALSLGMLYERALPALAVLKRMHTQNPQRRGVARAIEMIEGR